MAAAAPSVPVLLHLTYGLWMNMVERCSSALTIKKLQRSAHRSVKELAADIEAWVANWNENPAPFVWHRVSPGCIGSESASEDACCASTIGS